MILFHKIQHANFRWVYFYLNYHFELFLSYIHFNHLFILYICLLHWACYPIFGVFAFLWLQKCAPLTQKTCTHLRKLLTQQNQSALCKSLFWNPTCIAKMEKFLLLVISPKVFELQRCATTHIEENWSNFPIFTKYL